MLSSISTAVGLFNEALALAERSGLPCDELRLNVFAWRSRCYRRQRDYEAAREDVERALELAEAMHDARALGQAYFQASMLAERDGHWVLARTYAEKAKAQYEELADRANVGRLLNNLGGIEFLLGKPEQAVEHFKHAFAVALEIGRDEDAATAVSSLAQVHLRTGDVEARRGAGACTRSRSSASATTCSTRSATPGSCSGARCSMQDRLDEAETALAEAEDAFAQLSSASHRAAAWIAQGDLATRRGDERRAAVLYRRRPKRSRTSGSKGRRCSLWQPSSRSCSGGTSWSARRLLVVVGAARCMLGHPGQSGSVSGTARCRTMPARFARFQLGSRQRA